MILPPESVRLCLHRIGLRTLKNMKNRPLPSVSFQLFNDFFQVPGSGFVRITRPLLMNKAIRKFKLSDKILTGLVLRCHYSALVLLESLKGIPKN